MEKDAGSRQSTNVQSRNGQYRQQLSVGVVVVMVAVVVVVAVDKKWEHQRSLYQTRRQGME